MHSGKNVDVTETKGQGLKGPERGWKKQPGRVKIRVDETARQGGQSLPKGGRSHWSRKL